MNGYELSKAYWDFAFENPEKISPSHAAIYFFAIEVCNRLSWKSKFGLPTAYAMDVLGIAKHSTYSKYLNDLVEWGFITMHQKSKNQYTANVISLSFALPKKGKAMGKAMVEQGAKRVASDGSIDKPNKTIETKKEGVSLPFSSNDFKNAWDDWKEYKSKEHKFKFNSTVSEKSALGKLKSLGGNEKECIKIIYESISNGWKGFFELKDKPKQADNEIKIRKPDFA
mgnify:CR=1 FL=1